MEELDEVASTELPVISLDYSTANARIGAIDNDSYAGSCLGAQHLIDLGHRKIAYITYDKMSLNQIQRFKGYQDTLAKNHIEFDENLVVRMKKADAALVDSPEYFPVPWEDASGELFRKMRGWGGCIAMKLMLRRQTEFTAVMTADDCMALGAMSVLHENGVRIPEDISVVGFDNYAETVFWTPPLTTINHSIETAGYMAIKSMHEAIKKPGRMDSPAGSPPHQSGNQKIHQLKEMNPCQVLMKQRKYMEIQKCQGKEKQSPDYPFSRSSNSSQ
eukprot:TRINITY_DN148_c0_g2_i2.p1 TRINITY_DN148_c0_g2~~TRINITY_DN148_c0_g2_i2.p1  ORF type:complete len:309 (-),score=58.22 TRINITY_DN148_c0_g2_i2:517-1338(-)